jgi:hypothetical protein
VAWLAEIDTIRRGEALTKKLQFSYYRFTPGLTRRRSNVRCASSPCAKRDSFRDIKAQKLSLTFQFNFGVSHRAPGHYAR